MRSDNVRRVLPEVNTKYGAPMGRPNVDECEIEVANNGEWYHNVGKTYDKRVPMIDGAYDIGGAYWGIGNELRVKFNKDLTYINFYRVE